MPLFLQKIQYRVSIMSSNLRLKILNRPYLYLFLLSKYLIFNISLQGGQLSLNNDVQKREETVKRYLLFITGGKIHYKIIGQISFHYVHYNKYNTLQRFIPQAVSTLFVTQLRFHHYYSCAVQNKLQCSNQLHFLPVSHNGLPVTEQLIQLTDSMDSEVWQENALSTSLTGYLDHLG